MVKHTRTILRQNLRNFLSVFDHFMGLVSKGITVTRKLNPNKAYGFDRISIRMFQVCDKRLCKPLYFIFLPVKSQESSQLNGNDKYGTFS